MTPAAIITPIRKPRPAMFMHSLHSIQIISEAKFVWIQLIISDSDSLTLLSVDSDSVVVKVH